MTTLEAHELLAERDPDTGRDAWPFIVNVVQGELACDGWPASATAAALLSGGLDEAKSDDDLDELLKHAQALLGAGIIDSQQLVNEAHTIIDLVLRAGDTATAHERN